MQVEIGGKAGSGYASVGRRFAAAFIDSIIVGLVGVVVGLALGLGGAVAGKTVLNGDLGSNLLGMFVGWTYAVLFIGSKGQTPGKMAMKIKVIKEESGQAPGYGGAILREVFGKLISSVVLLLGYLWAFWDGKKQTWHDKIAGTVVVNC